MTYTKQEKQKLERVIAVFAERLKESDAFDLVWSDKVGYVLLDISTNYDYVDSARRIETADPLERAEIQRLWQPYFEQLPEYEYLREVLTSEWP